MEFKANEINVGRGEGSDIKLPDVSVSRSHGSLLLVGNEIVLKDNNSKFGTLKQLKEPLPLVGTPLKVQCGRTLLYLKVHYPNKQMLNDDDKSKDI